MGEILDSGMISCLDGSAKNVISPVNLAVVQNYPLRFEIRADNRRFAYYNQRSGRAGRSTLAKDGQEKLFSSS